MFNLLSYYAFLVFLLGITLVCLDHDNQKFDTSQRENGKSRQKSMFLL